MPDVQSTAIQSGQNLELGSASLIADPATLEASRDTQQAPAMSLCCQACGGSNRVLSADRSESTLQLLTQALPLHGQKGVK